MKLVVLFLTIGISISYAGNSYSQVTTLSLKMKNKTVREVFNEIEKSSEYIFLYNRETLDPERVVSINAEKETINDVLDKLFEGTDNTYKVSDRQVYISKEEKFHRTPIIEPTQQKKTVRGTIVDQNGESIIGANIVEKGTLNGTVTDINGKFILELDKDGVLQISYIGYLTQEISTEDRSSLDIVLQEDTGELDELVVIGYGTQKKANLTGAVASVTAEKLENRPIASTGQGLQGLIPNLNVTISDGDPSTASNYNIRGFTSINGGDPLILVDGTPMDIDVINPNDIASVVVLKDASAAAIYGARAAFGVILVETKQGRTKKAQITFSTEQSLSKPIFKYDPVTDPYVYKIWYNKANMRTNGVNSYSDYSVEKSRIWSENPTDENAWEVINGTLQFYGNSDYMNRMLSDFSPQQKYDLTLSKRTDDASFYVSLGHLSKDGYIKNDDWNEKYKRYNVLMKSDIKVTPWLWLDNKVSFNAEDSDKPHVYNRDVSFNSVVRLTPSSILEFPDLPYYIEPGDREKYEQYIGMYGGARLNQLPYLEQGGRTKYTKADIYLTQGVTLTPLKRLRVRGDFTYHTSFRKYLDAAPICYVPRTNLLETEMLQPAYFCTDDYVENQNTYRQDYQLNIYTEYEAPVFNGHYLKGMIGFNQEWGLYESNTAHAKDLILPTIINIQATTGLQQTSGSAQHVALRGMFFRFNYNYMEKYLMEFSGRYDGTSRFPKDSRFGFFPSASVGWRISQEPFMKSTSNWLDNMKVRASYGSLGNQSLGSNYYPYIASMGVNTSYYFMNSSNSLLSYISAPELVASTLTWEKVISQNLGLDLTLLKQRLDLSFDIYTRDTKDMLLSATYPDILGANPPKENGADLRTKGWEFSATWRDRIGKDWSYDITLSLSDNQTEITKYENPSGSLTTWRKGMKTGEVWGYQTEGIFQYDEEVAAHADQSALGIKWQAGDIKYADLNNDGVISAGSSTFDDPGDRRIIGNTTPRYSFGIFPKITYKNWSLGVFFQGVMKQDYMPPGEADWVAFYPFKSNYIDKYYLTETWSEDNRDAYFAAPHISANNPKNTYNQSRYIQNSAYIRLKNLTVSYNLPREWMNKIGFSAAQVYLGGMNLWEYSKIHKPLDPESTTLSLRYPRQRTFSFGVKVSF